MFKYKECFCTLMPSVRHAILEDYVTKTIEDLGDDEVISAIDFVNGFALRYRVVNVPIRHMKGVLDGFVWDQKIMVLYPGGITKETAPLSDTYYKRVLPPL